MNEHSKSERYLSTYTINHDQAEISLVDLWLMFARNKWLFAIVFALVFALGATYAFIKPTTYSYSTLIEIGSRLVGDEIKPIELPTSVATKLKKGYIPQAQQQYYEAFPADKAFYSVDVSAPENGALVSMESTGSEEAQSVYVAIHRTAMDELLKDHERIISIIRESLKSNLTNQENQLASLQNQQTILNDQLQRLEVTQKK